MYPAVENMLHCKGNLNFTQKCGTFAFTSGRARRTRRCMLHKRSFVLVGTVWLALTATASLAGWNVYPLRPVLRPEFNLSQEWHPEARSGKTHHYPLFTLDITHTFVPRQRV